MIHVVNDVRGQEDLCLCVGLSQCLSQVKLELEDYLLFVSSLMVRELPCKYIIINVVVKDLRLEDEDKDEDLKTGPRGSSRTRTSLEDKNTAV